MPPFRFQASNVYLTYPHTSIPLEDFKSSLLRLHPNCSYLVACREHHADGDVHLHAYVEFNERLRHSNPLFWDLETRHPHVKHLRGTKDKQRVIQYIKKDGDWTEHGLEPTDGGGVWGEAVNAASEADFWGVILEKKPDAIRSFSNLQSFAKWKWPERSPLYTSPDLDFDISETMDKWVEDNLQVRAEDPPQPPHLRGGELYGIEEAGELATAVTLLT